MIPAGGLLLGLPVFIEEERGKRPLNLPIHLQFQEGDDDVDAYQQTLLNLQLFLVLSIGINTPFHMYPRPMSRILSFSHIQLVCTKRGAD